MKNNIESRFLAADDLYARGNRSAAIAAYREALATSPDLPERWLRLGVMLREQSRFADAVAAYDEAIARTRANPAEMRLAKAFLLGEHLRREDEAEAEYRKILAENSGDVVALLNLGNLLEDRGERQGAIDCYSQILPPADGGIAAHLELRAEALGRLCRLVEPASIDDPIFARIEAVASRYRLALPVRANLFFALGAALDRLREFDRAFAAYEEANRCVRRAGPSYDRRRIESDVSAQISIKQSGDQSPPCADQAPRLIFICGMFRSGSTLVEQVLAAHPEITPGGELDLLNRIADMDLAPFPQSLRTLTNENAARLRRRYCADLARLIPAAAVPGAIITDKRPDNFLRIGLIQRLFPDAKIIHTMRNPIDTCLSIYFQHIDQGLVGYSSDLADTAHYFVQYRRMMAHWKAQFPDKILDFDYDEFVREPKPALEALLAFIGAPWNDQCLRFHELRNVVKTASYWQVRNPLNASSSGRWRNYRRFLTPAIEVLRSVGVKVD